MITRTNWAKTSQYEAIGIYEASSANHVSTIVRRARELNHKVYVQGSEHHWGISGQSESNTIVVKLINKSIGPLTVIDEGIKASIRVGGAVTLEELNAYLGQTEWAVPCMGAIAEQTVTGLVSTNTHGTHPRHGGFSTLVAEFEFVDSAGGIYYCKKQDSSWDFSRTMLGCAGKRGIITSCTLELVPAFNLQYNERMLRLTQILEPEYLAMRVSHAEQANEFVGWFLFPNSWRRCNTGCPQDDILNTGAVQELSWKRTQKPGIGRGRLRSFVEGLVANVLFRFLDHVIDRDFEDLRPDWMHIIVRLMVCSISRETQFVGRSDLTLTADPKTPIFSQAGSHTAEFYVRFECAGPVILRLLCLVDEMLSLGRCFVWKPMRTRIMRGDDISLCSQVYEEIPSGTTNNLYLTIDVDIYHGQYVGNIEDIYADMRRAINDEISRFNERSQASIPFTGFHLGKVIPYSKHEYGDTVLSERPGIRMFAQFFKDQDDMRFLHREFEQLIGL